MKSKNGMTYLDSENEAITHLKISTKGGATYEKFSVLYYNRNLWWDNECVSF